MKKIPTVTVALSALNEEHNIGPFLKSVLAQKEEGFILKKILVISDGSTDKTVKVARSFKSKKIVVKNNKVRIGKSSRLNEIYSGLDTDYLVQSDADVIFAHKYVIRDLIEPLKTEKNIYMCGGYPQPKEGKTFVEKAVNCTFEAYASLRDKNNSLSVDGRLLAYKKALVKKIHVPEDMIANDAYTFFACLSLGYKYKYVSSAIVWFRSPQTVKDQIKQNTRFLAAPIRMSRFFPPELVESESHLSFFDISTSMLLQFIKHPIYCVYIVIINAYCRLKAKSAEKRLTAQWPMAYTTKTLVNK